MLNHIIDKTKAKPSGEGYSGHCPAHDDKNPSLSIWEHGGSVHLKCHAGCDSEKIWNDLGLSRKQESSKSSSFQSIWSEARSIDIQGLVPASKYLLQRGIRLDAIPSSLGFVPQLPYYEEKNLLGEFPALVARITDKHRQLTGIHRIYLDQDGMKAKVKDVKKVLGKVSGAGIHLGAASGVCVHITEGLETGLAIYQALQRPVIAAVNADNLAKLEFEEGIKEIHIWVDKDRSMTGEKQARKAADTYIAKGYKVFQHLPSGEVSEGVKSIDWLDVLNSHGVDHIVHEFRENSKIAGWEQKPKEVSFPEPKLPQMDESLIPGVMRTRCLDISKRLGVPVEMVFLPMLAAYGSLVGLKLAVQPKAKDESWTELPNIWSVTIGRPSVKKTACLNAATQPLQEIAALYIEDFASDSRVREVRKEILNKRYQKLMKEAEGDKITPKGLDEIGMEAIDLKKQIDMIPTQPKRLSTSDATMEKLCEMLRDNPNGLALIRDEIAGWILAMRKSGREGEREFFLESWTGMGSFDQDRIGRGHIHVSQPRVCVIGSTQPSKAESLVNPGHKDFVDDGLLQRFQFLLYYRTSPAGKGKDEAEDLEAKEMVEELFSHTRDLEPPSHLRAKGALTRVVPFSEGARSIVDEWFENLHETLNSIPQGQELLESHLAKYSGLMPKIALLFECVAHYRDYSQVIAISKEATLNACQLVDFLEAHARIYYGSIEYAPFKTAQMLVSRIKSKKLSDGLTVRELARKHWRGTKKRDDLDAALSILEEHHWIKIMVIKPEHGRSSEVIRIHPELQTS